MSNARILFGAESFCWPDESLANEYPEVHRGRRYLNSGGYIGYASSLLKLLKSKEIENKDDDQLYFTKLFLDESIRDELKIKLDTKSSIFHNLNGATAELEMQFDGGVAKIVNSQQNTNPLVLHGNGPTKHILNSYGNYLANNWNEESGCASCWDDMISLTEVAVCSHAYLKKKHFILKINHANFNCNLFLFFPRRKPSCLPFFLVFSLKSLFHFWKSFWLKSIILIIQRKEFIFLFTMM